MREAAVQALVLLGAVFVLLSALGMLRMPDSLSRMQVLTKGTTLGVLLVMIGAAVFFGGGGESARAFLVVAFIYLTTPVSAHMVARAAMRRRDSRSRLTLLSNDYPEDGPDEESNGISEATKS